MPRSGEHLVTAGEARGIHAVREHNDDLPADVCGRLPLASEFRKNDVYSITESRVTARLYFLNSLFELVPSWMWPASPNLHVSLTDTARGATITDGGSA